MPDQAIKKLEKIEMDIHFMSNEIPQQSSMVNRDFLAILDNISQDVQETIKILEGVNPTSNQLVD